MTLSSVTLPSFNARSMDVRRRIEAMVRSMGSCAERDVPDVVELLRDHLAIATARHGAWMAVETFVEHVLSHAAQERPGFVARLVTLHSADLYLALAAALDLPDAIACIEDEHIRGIDALLWRIEGGVRHASEIRRRARRGLLATMPRTRLRSYSGRSSLRDWIRVYAVRELRDLRDATSPSRTVDRSSEQSSV